jgi:hypothetical protein
MRSGWASSGPPCFLLVTRPLRPSLRTPTWELPDGAPGLRFRAFSTSPLQWVGENSGASPSLARPVRDQPQKKSKFNLNTLDGPAMLVNIGSTGYERYMQRSPDRIPDLRQDLVP